MISYTVDRSSLSLSDLVISAYPTNGLWVPEDDNQRPEKVWRRQTASSQFIHGTVQTGATLDQATLPLTVYAQATTTSELRTLMDTVEEAFLQFTYDVTVTEDGDADVWACYCADITWNDYDAGMARAHIAKATISAPCYPVAS